jgi:hypothetical protein
MSIKVYRTSDRTAASDYGREITDNATVALQFDTMVGIFFSTEQSSFSVLIKPESFKALAELMMEASANEAIKAFGVAIQAGIEKPQTSN